MTGPPSSTNKLLFLGDYVDRGNFAVEIIILLLCMKLCYPEYVFLLRGNHETRQMSSHHNFKAEVVHKFDQEVYDYLMFVFDCLPVCAVVSNSLIAMHGGINPEMMRGINEINRPYRFQEVQSKGLICDIIWSDPMAELDYQQTGGQGNFYMNDARGCGVKYGQDATTMFLAKNNLKTIFRGHEVFQEGFKIHDSNSQVITVFSAPNYCGNYMNLGAIITITNKQINVQ